MTDAPVETEDRDPQFTAVMESAAHLQRLVPDAVLVGGAAAILSYRRLRKRWSDWSAVTEVLGDAAARMVTS